MTEGLILWLFHGYIGHLYSIHVNSHGYFMYQKHVGPIFIPFSSYETRAVEWSIGHPPKLWSWGCGTESRRWKRNVANVDWRFLAGWKPFQKSGWYFSLGHIGNQWSCWLIWLIWFGKIVGHLVVGALLKVPWFPWNWRDQRFSPSKDRSVRSGRNNRP